LRERGEGLERGSFIPYWFVSGGLGEEARRMGEGYKGKTLFLVLKAEGVKHSKRVRGSTAHYRVHDRWKEKKNATNRTGEGGLGLPG